MKIQFRLRTLMIVVTLLAVPLGYVGWQAKIVREREALINRGVPGSVVYPDGGNLPLPQAAGRREFGPP